MRAHYAVQDTAADAPFTAGDLVLFRDAPLYQPMTVVRCEWRAAHWRVVWAAGGEFGAPPTVGHAPADHLMPAPLVVIGELVPLLWEREERK